MISIGVIQTKTQERREKNMRLKKTCAKTLKERNPGRFKEPKEAQSSWWLSVRVRLQTQLHHLVGDINKVGLDPKRKERPLKG